MVHTKPSEIECATQHLIQDEGHEGSRKSNSNSVDTHEAEMASVKLSQVSPMSRFYSRSIVIIFIPPLVAVYYVFIWLVLLRKDTDPVIKYASVSELWVYYSWFVICTFGIGWSKYGLAGIEVAMLQSRRFGVVDKETLYMHSGNSWSGPDGWIECLGRFMRGKESQVHRLWYLLSALSLLPFVAHPFSGFCMELSDGYVFSSSAPRVIGRKWEDFNNRQVDQTTFRAQSRWETGASTGLPGIGILYTPPNIQRNKIDGLRSLPNKLPHQEPAPDLFVCPQAKTPIEGRAWGLRVEYNCSIVRDASEFTIISDRSNIINQPTSSKPTNGDVIVPGGSQGTVYVSNSGSAENRLSFNLFSYIEMGVSKSSGVPTYDETEIDPIDSHPQPYILELAMWQMRKQGAYETQTAGFQFNQSIDDPLKGMGQPIIQLPNGTYASNRTFFEAYDTNYALEDFASLDGQNFLYLAPPIGLRCTRFSALGLADLAASTSSFHNFTRTPPPDFKMEREEARAPLFGYTAMEILRRQYLKFFDSINLPTPITVSNSVFYTRFLQARELQQSVMLAHAIDALQLMYDGVTSFENSYLNPNLTSSTPGKVLTPGVAPALFPAVLFLAWAGICSILGVKYGFVRRCADTLDRRYLLRLDNLDKGCI